MIGDAHMPIRSILATCLPAGAAILVFRTLYGAAARAIMGVPLTLASSVFIFSGALQFALLALLSAGATMLPLVGFDHERLTYRFQGRDFRLTDVAGHVVIKLIA